jgi:2',3'-cyclic-nucleotide 2'-phosphodiesterase (5'-nucleotidase family)
MAFRKDEKEQKSLERAQKEAEMVGEFAKDARNRREANTIADKLEATVEQNEEKQAIENVLDKTKDEIKVATRKDVKEIPQYTQRLGDIQEQTIQTTREIADNYIESQKEIISICQSVWTPFVENANSRFWNYWSISPKEMAEIYGTVVSSFADNIIAATRLTNNAVFANMELFSTALQQTKDSSKEFSRLGVNAAKVFNEASNDFVTQVSLT